jgi:replicative superfamily II helicase
MTQNDENNIEFVLSIGANQISDWISKMDDNEILYALSIIECANWKLLDEAVENLSDCKAANKILKTIWKKYDATK